MWKNHGMTENGTNDPGVHLNNHHSDTLAKIFTHPVNHNIHWNDVISLVDAVGSSEAQHDGRYKITIGSDTRTFDRPKHKDIDTQQVIDLRHMLEHAGIEPGDKKEI